MPVTPVKTRFRAYQLCQAGASFSYFAGNHFTLIEAMATDASRPSIKREMEACNKTLLDTLHITSWDNDHCGEAGLAWILEELQPAKIEYPGYEPHSECGKRCLAQILDYQRQRSSEQRKVRAQKVDPDYIRSLKDAQGLGYNDMFYHPKEVGDCSNDNSTVKFFRSGMFNVLSLGDVEHDNIGSMLRNSKILCQETDVMILAHHGSENGITTKKFLRHINPSVAICNSNFANHYDHPSQKIRDLLHEEKICLYTTKTGDVLIQSEAPHTRQFKVTNFKANSTEISSERMFDSRKAPLLSGHSDSIRNRYKPGFKGIKV